MRYNFDIFSYKIFECFDRPAYRPFSISCFDRLSISCFDKPASIPSVCKPQAESKDIYPKYFGVIPKQLVGQSSSKPEACIYITHPIFKVIQNNSLGFIIDFV